VLGCQTSALQICEFSNTPALAHFSKLERPNSLQTAHTQSIRGGVPQTTITRSWRSRNCPHWRSRAPRSHHAGAFQFSTLVFLEIQLEVAHAHAHALLRTGPKLTTRSCAVLFPSSSSSDRSQELGPTLTHSHRQILPAQQAHVSRTSLARCITAKN
jgi:hypothetical protein